jgi:8-oxo-dGTP pyrophosphatase MutT (NUDIX family)
MLVDKKKRSKSVQLLSVTEKQYAALCFRHVPGSEDPIQVLLITSRATGRWVIPKGWSMLKKKPYEVARREAWEEAGIRGRVRKKPCGYYTYTKKLSEEDSVLVVVQVHLLNVLELDREFPEKGQRELRWFSPGAASAAVYEPELKRLVASVRELAIQFLSAKPDIW